MLKRILLAYHDRPPIMDYLQKSFERNGISVKQFIMETNHWFDKWFIHIVDKQLWNLKLLPKGRSVFEGHPLTHIQYRSNAVKRLVEEFKPNVFLLIRGWRITEEVLESIGKKCAVMGWWVDGDSHRMNEVFDEMKYYNHYFFFNSSGVEAAKRRGYEHVSLMHHAVDPDSFYPLVNAPKIYDCCFVGGWTEKRQLFIEKALDITNNVAIYGPRWRKKNITNLKILQTLKGDYISGKDLVELYNSTRIILNITTWSKEGILSSGMNMRILEVPACRALLLTDTSRDIDNLVLPNKHVAIYEGLEDFAQKISYYLQNRKEGESISEAGYNHVIMNHSYNTIVRNIVDVYNRIKGI